MLHGNNNQTVIVLEESRLMPLPGIEARFLGRHYTHYAIPASKPSLFNCISFSLTYESRT
jgi:hypothetical protein